MLDTRETGTLLVVNMNYLYAEPYQKKIVKIQADGYFSPSLSKFKHLIKVTSYQYQFKRNIFLASLLASSNFEYSQFAGRDTIYLN